MDAITRESTIKALKEQLELNRLRSASLDSDADCRKEMAETANAIQLLLEFMEKQRKSDRL